MRVRFFAIILVVLLTVATGATALHSIFVRSERISLIDQQVRETATALVDSNLGQIRKVDFETVDQIISDELGESRIGKFFLIRNDQGQLLYASSSAKVLPMVNIPQTPQWITQQSKGRYIRVLNLKLPRIPDRTLQVGIVVEKELIDPNFLSLSTFSFIVTITGLGLVAAWILTSSLWQPLRLLESFITRAAYDSSAGQIPPVPEALFSLSGNKNDEFRKVLLGLNDMIDRINRGYRLSRTWTYQMAHELKTPVAVLSVQIERALASGAITADLANQFTSEVKQIGDTVSAFLGWAELENSRYPQEVHALKIDRILTSVANRLASQYPGRIVMSVESDFYILSDPFQFEFMIQNLLTNALRYSPPDTPVIVKFHDETLDIEDRGPGIPSQVLERIGEPFNKGNKRSEGDRSGHGLGLAWVVSVVRRNKWKMNVKSQSDGTKISIQFPKNQPSEQMDQALG